MNEDIRKATDRLDRLERTVQQHESVLAKIIRVISPLRRRRRRITKPSIRLDPAESAALRAEMAAHGVDDETTVDTRGRTR